MLELWSSATTIATPCPAILVYAADGLRASERHSQGGDRQPAQERRQPPEPDPADAAIGAEIRRDWATQSAAALAQAAREAARGS